MPNATAGRYRAAFIKEVTFGTTPAAALTIFRGTGGGGALTAQSAESQELGLAEVPDVVRTGVELGGTMPFELSFGALDVFLESIFGAAWATNVLKVGSTKIGLTIEDQYPDVPLYNTWRGCLIESLRLNFALGSIATGQIGYRAISSAHAATSAGTGGPTAAPTNAVMGPVSEIQAATEGGSKNLLTEGITAFSLEIARPVIPQPGLGTLNLLGMDPAQFSLKGSFSVYYPDDTIFAKYRNNTMTSLAFTVGGASTLRYAFLMSKVRLTSGGPQAAQKDQAIAQTYQFQAVYDATNSTCQITRTP
jgi:hypothetical protein